MLALPAGVRAMEDIMCMTIEVPEPHSMSAILSIDGRGFVSPRSQHASGVGNHRAHGVDFVVHGTPEHPQL